MSEGKVEDSAAIAAVLQQEAQRRSVRGLEHRGREPVDDDQDDWLRGRRARHEPVSRAPACAALRSALGVLRRSRSASKGIATASSTPATGMNAIAAPAIEATPTSSATPPRVPPRRRAPVATIAVPNAPATAPAAPASASGQANTAIAIATARDAADRSGKGPAQDDSRREHPEGDADTGEHADPVPSAHQASSVLGTRV